MTIETRQEGLEVFPPRVLPQAPHRPPYVTLEFSEDGRTFVGTLFSPPIDRDCLLRVTIERPDLAGQLVIVQWRVPVRWSWTDGEADHSHHRMPQAGDLVVRRTGRPTGYMTDRSFHVDVL